MNILTLSDFPEYELIDSGDGMRLERFSQYRISRPDPQAIWARKAPSEWARVDASFVNGVWQNHKIPERWNVKYKDITLHAKLTPFKHTGIFPEQAVMWDWSTQIIKTSIKGSMKPKILNLFAYTGGASVAAAQAGAQVTHVDASKPSLTWARENMLASGLPEDAIRWILDDVVKFVKREVKRGNRYDGIIMDPPVYGHGPKGEAWDFFKHVPELIALTQQLLSDKPLFYLVNAYAVSASSIMLGNMLQDVFQDKSGTVEYGELALQESIGKRLLSTGIYGRWRA